MAKILRIINRLNLGGPTYNVAFLTKYLEPEFETRLLAGIKEDDEEESEYILSNYGVKCEYLDNMKRSINFFDDFRSFIEIVKIIRKFKPDIVHTHAAKSGFIGRTAAFICGVKIIIHTYHGHIFHSYFGVFKTKFFIALEKILALISTKIIAISTLQEKELVDVFKIAKKEKFSIVTLGVDLDKFKNENDKKREMFRANFSISKDTIAVGIIGRLTNIKNHDLFLKTLKEVKKISDKNINGYIIGDGEEKKRLKELCNSLDLTFTEDRFENNYDVYFTSWIKDIDKVYPGLDVVVCTSFNEGTPISLIEAQASAVPVITKNIGGVGDIILNNKTGYLVNNDLEFLEKLAELINNDDLRMLLSANCEKVVNKFHYTELVKNMRNLYNDLLREKNI